MASPYDIIGFWSEIKLEIVRNYATEYSKILSARKNPNFYHVYIDAFAGAGVNISRSAEDFVPGSPLNATLVVPPFKWHYFIDIESKKVETLKEIFGERSDVSIYEGDCNKILLDKIFPQVKYEDYKRGLCLLDPYALHLNWEVVETAGKMKSIEIFLNFPAMTINRNVIRKHRTKVKDSQVEQMNSFWGDGSWQDIAYIPRQSLLTEIEVEDKAHIENLVEAYRERLKSIAGFEYVPNPMPMKNAQGAIVFYLFFASNNPVAKKIVGYIFNKYSARKAT